MKENIKVKCAGVKHTDIKLIKRIAAWYLVQFGIPEDRTISRLKNYPNEEVLVQLVLKEGNRIIATGGLYIHTALSIIFPRYKALSPWISFLYTEKEYRKKGYGAILMQKLEEYAVKADVANVYVFTTRAGKYFDNNGYRQIEKLKYRGLDTLVMEKVLLH